MPQKQYVMQQAQAFSDMIAAGHYLNWIVALIMLVAVNFKRHESRALDVISSVRP